MGTNLNSSVIVKHLARAQVVNENERWEGIARQKTWPHMKFDLVLLLNPMVTPLSLTQHIPTVVNSNLIW